MTINFLKQTFKYNKKILFLMIKKNFINSIWKTLKNNRKNFIRVNNEDGSMPTITEFKKMITKYGH
jgi:hypothetical protein